MASSPKMLSLLFVSCGLGVTLLSHAVEKPKDELGPSLAALNNNLFNDLVLVNGGMFGMARNPDASFHGPSSNKEFTATQKSLLAFRSKMMRDGYKLQEALLRSPLARWPISNHDSETFHEEREVGCYLMFGQTGNDYKGAPRLAGPVPLALGDKSKDGIFVPKVYHASKLLPSKGKFENYTYYAAPITFQHKECLSCHKGKSLGDTAAVYIALFSKSNDALPLIGRPDQPDPRPRTRS